MNAATPLARARAGARRAMVLEHWLIAAAPSGAVLGAWLACSLAGAPLLLPPIVLAPLTGAAFAVAAAIGWRRTRAIAAPEPVAVDRRIERASSLPHRPLGTLRDRSAVEGSPETAALWAAHQARTGAALARLRPVWPRPDLRPIDPYRLRYAIPAAIAVGLALAGSDGSERLFASLLPGLASVPGPAGRLQAWITPPRFSGEAPIFVRTGAILPAIPAGSLLTVDLGGSDAIPRLVMGGAGAPTRFRRLAPGSWQATAHLTASGTIRVRQGGHRVAIFDLAVTPVGAPVVSWNGSPGAWHGGWRTRLPWQVGDRYGMTALRAELRPVRPAGAPAISLAIPLDGSPRAASGAEMPDLSASPFAGTPVNAVLIGRNGAGRTGRSQSVRFVLPARPFHDPLARAILAVRQRLALRPDARDAATRDLQALADVPGVFDGRAGLFVNLAGAAALLAVDPDPGAVDEAEERLWQLALQLEDQRRESGAPARAALALQAARDAVDRQVARMRSLGASGRTPADEAELARRMARLQAALAARLGALLHSAARNGTALPPEAMKALGAGSLDRMMRSISAAAAAGRMDEAERKLSQLEDMLDRMRPATEADIRRVVASMQAREAAAAQSAAVADMVRRQAALLDRATRRGDAPPAPAAVDPRFGSAPDLSPPPPTPVPAPPPPPAGAASAPGGGGSPPPNASSESPTRDGSPPGAGQAARDADGRTEDALARAAGALADQAAALSGKRPEALGRAGGAMRNAARQLARGDDRGANAAELEALHDLQSGSQQMQQALSRPNGGAGSGGGEALLPGFGPADQDAGDGGDDGQGTEENAGRGGERDPLGRSVSGHGNGNADDTELAIPGDAADAQSRAIEEELRRRDSDRQRPREELDYLGRLLQPF